MAFKFLVIVSGTDPRVYQRGYEPVLSCSFDSNDPECAVQVKTNGTSPDHSTTAVQSQLVGAYKFTDVSSISKQNLFALT